MRGEHKLPYTAAPVFIRSENTSDTSVNWQTRKNTTVRDKYQWIKETRNSTLRSRKENNHKKVKMSKLLWHYSLAINNDHVATHSVFCFPGECLRKCLFFLFNPYWQETRPFVSSHPLWKTDTGVIQACVSSFYDFAGISPLQVHQL